MHFSYVLVHFSNFLGYLAIWGYPLEKGTKKGSKGNAVMDMKWSHFGAKVSTETPPKKGEILGPLLNGQKRHWDALWTALGPKGVTKGAPWAGRMCLKHSK